MYLSLDSDVDLYRTRSLIIRCENPQGYSQSSREKVPNVVWVRSLQIQRISVLILLPKLKYGGNGIPRMNVVAARTSGRCNRSAGYGYGRWYTIEAGIRSLVEGTGLQPERSVKQYVVEDDVFVEQTRTRADHSPSILVGIPRDANLRREIHIGLIDPVPHPRKGSIDGRIGPEVAIGASGIVVISQSNGQREVRLDLPTVPKVPPQAIVGAQTASREAQCRRESAKSQAVSISDSLHRIIERISRSTGVRACRCEVDICKSVMPRDTRSLPEEICESTALDMIERYSIAKDVRVEGLASVVLEFVVRLWRTLRGVRAGTGIKARTERIQRNPSVGKGKFRPQRRIHYLILKLHVRETDRVGESSCVKVGTRYVSTSDVFVGND